MNTERAKDVPGEASKLETSLRGPSAQNCSLDTKCPKPPWAQGPPTQLEGYSRSKRPRALPPTNNRSFQSLKVMELSFRPLAGIGPTAGTSCWKMLSVLGDREARLQSGSSAL